MAPLPLTVHTITGRAVNIQACARDGDDIQQPGKVSDLITLLRNGPFKDELPVGHVVRVVHSGKILNDDDDLGDKCKAGDHVHVVASQPRVSEQHSDGDDNDEDIEAIHPLDLIERDARLAARLSAMWQNEEQATEEEEQTNQDPGTTTRTTSVASRRARAMVGTTNRNDDTTLSSLRRRHNGDVWDFAWGFGLGFLIGPLAFFWAFDNTTNRQKIGLLVGIIVRAVMGSLKVNADLSLDDDDDDNDDNINVAMAENNNVS